MDNLINHSIIVTLRRLHRRNETRAWFSWSEVKNGISSTGELGGEGGDFNEAVVNLSRNGIVQIRSTEAQLSQDDMQMRLVDPF